MEKSGLQSLFKGDQTVSSVLLRCHVFMYSAGITDKLDGLLSVQLEMEHVVSLHLNGGLLEYANVSADVAHLIGFLRARCKPGGHCSPPSYSTDLCLRIAWLFTFITKH